MKFLLGHRWFSWPRAAAVLISAVLLCVAFRQIDLATLGSALGRTRPGWVLLAAAIYGLAILVSGLRWHLCLRLTERSVHASASCRLVFIGHFFVTALCGAAGGDLAKSAVYARWYRWQLPEVLAAAPLDRALGFGGTVALGCVVLGVAACTGGLARLQSLPLRAPGAWPLAVVLLVVAAIIGLILWRPAGEGAIARTIRAFRAGGGRMVVTPAVAGPGIACSFLTQAGLSTAFALNLAAVTSAPVPWLELSWAFAAITVISALAFTFGGAGVREVAALMLLTPAGIPAGDCVAAAVWTFALKVGWAAIGAVMLWREETRQAQVAQRPPPRNLSVVIPTLNEADAIEETVRRVRALPEVCEIIVVDGGSRDATRERAAALGCRVLIHAPSRGGQLRAGAATASGDVVLLLHADTWLPLHAGRAALHCLRDATVVAGGFWKRFQRTPPLMLGSRPRCASRLVLGGLILGDQAMFIRRDVLEQIGGVPDLPLMEEYALCARLRRVGRLALADATVTTSIRRFQKLGILRTYARMGRVALLYRLGWSPERLARIYERE